MTNIIADECVVEVIYVQTGTTQRPGGQHAGSPATTAPPRRRRLSPPMKPTPAMLAAAREDEDGWRRMPTSAVRHTLLWQAMLAAWNEETARGR